MKKIVVILMVILILAGVGVLVKKKKKELFALKPPKAYPIIVKTIKPKMENFYLSLDGLGLIESNTDVNISTKVASRILYLKGLGEHVKKNDVLVKLDDSFIKSKLFSLKSQLNALYQKLSSSRLSLSNMIKTHKRTLELLKVKGASIEQSQAEEDKIAQLKSEISTVKSQIRSAKEQLKSLNVELTYTLIKSPINGVVSKQISNVGDVAMPGKPILKISAEKGKYLLLRLPDDIKPKGVIFEGKFYKIFALNDTFNGLNEYEARVDTGLSVGSRVKVGVVVFKGNAYKLPFDALLSVGEKNYIFVYKDHHAYPVLAQIEGVGQQGVAVSNNLKDKNIVVAKPDILLKALAGTPLKVQ